MKRLKVAILAGGWSAEREVSLVSGKAVATGAKKTAWISRAYDLVPDGPEGSLLKRPAGFLRLPLSRLIPQMRRDKTDCVFLCLHGTGGEDGRMQGLLDLAGIPYTGSGVLASALGMDKGMSKRIFENHGLPTPAWALVAKGSRKVGFKGPWVVKPVAQGSAVGVALARDRSELDKGLKLAWRFGDLALVERYVKGVELTVGVLGEEALPCLQILPKNEFYDYESKYAPGGSRHLCPAPIAKAAVREAQRLALAAHRALGCRAYSRVDIMIDASGRQWILEINTLPGMTPVSLLPDAARVAGYTFERLLERMVALSLA